MNRRLRNVTITLDEETAGWARVEAARRDVSLSRFIGEMIQDRIESQDAYEESRRRYFRQEAQAHRPPGQSYPTRDEAHARHRLR
jgi:hypothetical protein